MIQRKVHEREDSLLPLISSEILRKTLKKKPRNFYSWAKATNKPVKPTNLIKEPSA